MNQERVKWHRLTADATVKKLHTNASSGLSRKEARLRYRRYGANTLFDGAGTRRPSALRALLTEPSWLFLLAVAVLSLCFGEAWSGILSLILILVGLVPAVRSDLLEQRLHSALLAGRIPSACVLRDGVLYRTSARRVAVGDVILLRRGDVVPADCRLLSASADFRVLTLMPNEKGRALWVALPKHAERVYGMGDPTEAPRVENMLYGASEITSGEAIAVVTEIGAYTYLGSMSLFVLPTEYHADANKDPTAKVGKYLRLYGFLMLILLIPMAGLGMLHYWKTRTLISVFLSVCAVAALGAPSLLKLFFTRPITELRWRFFCDASREGRALIKHPHAAEQLASTTDLFVIGHTAISNGVFRLHRLLGGAGDPSPQEMTSLCEAYFLLGELERTQGIAFSTVSLAELRQELFRRGAFDTDAMQVRLLDVRPISERAGDLRLQAVLRERSCELLFATRPELLAACEFYEHEGTLRYLSPTDRSALTEAAKREIAEGSRLHLVMHERDGRRVLVAIVALREEVQSVLPSTLAELSRNGVETRFFLRSEDASEVRYATRAKISSKMITREAAGNRPLWTLLADYRIFFGFDTAEITETVRRLSAARHRVAVVGESVEDLPILHAADLAITCELSDSQSRRELSEETETLGESTEAVIRHTDLQVGRAERLGGGLVTVTQILTQTRAHHAHMPPVFCFLCISQLFRLVLALTSLCLGVGLMNGVQLLFGGTVSELLLALLLTSVTLPPRSVLRTRGSDAALSDTALTRKRSAAPIATAAVTVLYAAILTWCGVWTPAVSLPFLCASMLAVQYLACFRILLSSKARPLRHRVLPMLLLPLLLIILGIALSIAFPTMGAVLGMGDWSLLSCLSLPLSPLLFVFFSIFFERTAK